MSVSGRRRCSVNRFPWHRDNKQTQRTNERPLCVCLGQEERVVVLLMTMMSTDVYMDSDSLDDMIAETAVLKVKLECLVRVRYVVAIYKL